MDDVIGLLAWLAMFAFFTLAAAFIIGAWRLWRGESPIDWGDGL